ADYNINNAKQLAGKLNKVGKTKVSAIREDANDYDEMVKTFKEENSDIICNLIEPYYKYGPPVVKASIESGIPYVDVKYDYKPEVASIDKLDKKAKDADLDILTEGVVLSGWTNMMAKVGSSKLEQTEKISVDWLRPALGGGEPGVTEHIYHM